MTISAQIIADSISPAGKRLTTLQLRYPRFIHAEVMTHRVFSRNASSSRAIPVKKLIEDIQRDPAIPSFWGKNQPGMQAGEDLNAWVLVPRGPSSASGYTRENAWLLGMERAIEVAQAFADAGYHKQVVNRLLEPWAHINVVVTATEWSNFFALRDHPDAQPEIKELAQAIKEAMAASDPMMQRAGHWHLPYITVDDWETAYSFLKQGRITRDEPTHAERLGVLRKVSAARCARVSYLTHDGRPTTVKEDLALFEKLLVSEPLHASPAEHQATPDEGVACGEHIAWGNPHLQANFVGWIQYRKTLPNECVEG